MKLNYNYLLTSLLITAASFAQVGIGTTTPVGALDITSATNGLVIPRIALTTTSASAPVVNPQGGGLTTGTLIWNTATAGVSPNQVTPGFYYWSGIKWIALGAATNAWNTTGNSGTNGGDITTAGTNFLGTADNQNLDIRTNNTFIARFSNLGEFFVGTLNTTLPGDLMNSVGNSTFPWALNGYTTFNGGGVYGSVQSGTTLFGGVQGEYFGTNSQGTGVRGIYGSNIGGTGFNATATGVTGNATSSGSYKFGVYGSGGSNIRSGGVMGYDYGIAMGALGYYASNGVDYSVFGFGQAHANGAAGGRSAQQTEVNTNIGLGIYGGVMGGWVRGMKYGFHTKGETYSLYVDGSGYTNKPFVYLLDGKANRKQPTYMSTGINPEVSANGKTQLLAGKIFVSFGKDFKNVIGNPDDLIITATPQGKSNGVYIDQITADGFWIKENNDGLTNVKIAWIAVTKVPLESSVPDDLLAKDFDAKMNGVMFNENGQSTAQSIWWDGSAIRWTQPPVNKTDTETTTLARPKN